MNKLKLGKKKILGFMTAGAIVVTMAGSYAAWDTLSSTATKDLTFATPVTTEVAMTQEFTEARTLNNLPKYEAPVTFTVKDLPASVTDVEASFDAKLIKADKTEVPAENYSITIKKEGTALTNNKDTAISTSAANTYSVEVVPANTEQGKALAGEVLTVSVTGTLAEKTP